MKDKLNALRKLIRETFPDHKESISIHLRASNESLSVTFYGCKDYAEGTAALRAIGIGEREKQILEPEKDDPFSFAPWTSVKGKIGDDEFSAYCDGLPPSCKKVTFTEKIPKTQTVDTGEFIEVERTKVVCGGENEVAK